MAWQNLAVVDVMELLSVAFCWFGRGFNWPGCMNLMLMVPSWY